MANIIRRIHRGENNSSAGFSNPIRPTKTEPSNKTSSNDFVRQRLSQIFSYHNPSLAMIADPRMQLLRARQKPPHEERIVQRSLLETIVYRLENGL